MRTNCERGFTLIELVAVVAIVGVLLVMLDAAGGESRRLARLGEDIAKLRQIGAWTGSYAADNSDLFWTYSWRKGQQLSQWPDLNQQALFNDVSANAAQGVDILRRLAGRTDIPPANAVVFQLNYSHLPLLEYLRTEFPDVSFVSTADTHRLKWARDPMGYDAGLYQPVPANWGHPQSRRWPYSTSFRLSTAFYDLSAAPSRISQDQSHQYLQSTAESRTGGRMIGDTAYPSALVHVHDINARHFGVRQPYCTHEDARLPFLFVDGAVRALASADSNPGWNTNQTWTATPVSFYYAPQAWEPATVSGTGVDSVIGRFRWTRGGIAGRDFGGPEVCTGQPGCP